MFNGDERFKVYNRTRCDIGVKLLNGVEYNIVPGSFRILTANDILYLETAFRGNFFTKKLLVPVGEDGKDIDMSAFGLGALPHAHRDDSEIADMLKQSAKKIEAWLDEIDDKEELHAIYEVAKDMDLPASKLKILNAHIKNKDWLGELDIQEG